MSACFSLPEGFARQLQLPDLDLLHAALDEAPPVSVRLNPSKIPAAYGLPLAQAVPWCPHGRYLRHRPSFTADPAHHAGAYYVQEASSMLLWQYVQAYVAQTDTTPLMVLDLCAAPGGKTTLLADCLPPGSELVANEVIAARASILKENVLRWGAGNIRVCRNDPEQLATQLGAVFDVVVVDAPCTGEGLWRKQPGAVAEWSVDAVAHCAARQSRILQQAWQLLKPGGLLVYSTCTYNRQENEDRVEELLLQPGSLPWQPALPEEWGFVAASPCGYHAYPHRVQGEGFFIAGVVKQGGFISTEWPTALPKPPKQQPPWLQLPDEFGLLAEKDMLYVHRPTALPAAKLSWQLWDLPVAEQKGKDWVPTHELAQHPQFLAAGVLPMQPLLLDQALAYLKGLDPGTAGPVGWQLVTWQDIPLGWQKHLGNRNNNYYPRHLRILKDLDNLIGE